jgi:hypothetical protein
MAEANGGGLKRGSFKGQCLVLLPIFLFLRGESASHRLALRIPLDYFDQTKQRERYGGVDATLMAN